MKKLNEEELLTITGGASVTGSIVNAVCSIFKFIYDVGRDLGSCIRRIEKSSLCPLE